jgi:hypothetical protein
MQTGSFLTEVEQRLNSRPNVRSVLRYEYLLSLVAFALFWSGLLIYSGTLNSGYHLIDDWEVLMITDHLDHSSLRTVTAYSVLSDLTARMRPWFYIQRIFTLWLIGFNMTLLNIQLLVTAVLSSLLLYAFARSVGFGAINSLFFVFLSFLGHQTAVWWRLGAAEPIGILWFALGLLFMARSLDRRDGRTVYKVLSLTGFILASLTKESFVVLLPVASLAWLTLSPAVVDRRTDVCRSPDPALHSISSAALREVGHQRALSGSGHPVHGLSHRLFDCQNRTAGEIATCPTGSFSSAAGRNTALFAGTNRNCME